MPVTAFRLTSMKCFPPTQRRNFTSDSVGLKGTERHEPRVLFCIRNSGEKEKKNERLTVGSYVSSSLLYAFYKRVSIRQSYSGFRHFSLQAIHSEQIISQPRTRRILWRRTQTNLQEAIHICTRSTLRCERTQSQQLPFKAGNSQSVVRNVSIWM